VRWIGGRSTTTDDTAPRNILYHIIPYFFIFIFVRKSAAGPRRALFLYHIILHRAKVGGGSEIRARDSGLLFFRGPSDLMQRCKAGREPGSAVGSARLLARECHNCVIR
jgi:hypothetical protein